MITDLLGVVLACGLVVFGLCFGIHLLLKGTFRLIFSTLCVALSLALYLQGNYLNISYGALNGKPIPWGTFGLYPIWNTLIWCGLLLLPVIAVWLRPKRFRPAVHFLSVFLLLMEIVSLSALLLTTDLSKNSTQYYLSTKDEFNLSKNENIVVFGIDSFAPDLFAEIRELYPESVESWTGFVEFPNHVGTFPTTPFAVCNLMTGQAYTLQQDRSAFMEEAYRDSIFFPTLKANQYDVDFFSSEATVSYCEVLFDNLVTSPVHVNSYFGLFKKMYRLTGFSYAPHLAKRVFWMNTADFEELRATERDDLFIRNDATFRKRFDANGLRVEKENNSFHFYFLWGPHAPYILSKPDETTFYDNDIVTLHSQTLHSMSTITAIMDAMKEEGLYDDATIIIISDHGDEIYDNAPILLVKRPGATGPLTQNDSFVSHNDFQATVFAAVGIDATSDIGKNVFDVGDEKRTFTFYDLVLYADVEYQYDITMLPSGLLHYEQRDTWYDLKGDYPVTPTPVQLGKTYSTPSREAAVAYFNYINHYRIFARKDDAVWLANPGVTLHVQAETVPPEGLAVEFELADVMNGLQRVEVYRKDKLFHTATVTAGQASLVIDIPPECCVDGEIILELRFPDAMSEYEKNGFSGHGDPIYRQAIAIKSITFYPQSN